MPHIPWKSPILTSTSSLPSFSKKQTASPLCPLLRVYVALSSPPFYVAADGAVHGAEEIPSVALTSIRSGTFGSFCDGFGDCKLSDLCTRKPPNES